jgi:hypothetical protein
MGSFSIWHWIIVLLVFAPAILGIFVFRQTPVRVIHKDSGLVKTVRLGWSWTYWYFGFLVPVFRGEIGIGVLHMVISVFTFGLFQVLMSFLYNRQQLTRLLEKGWILAPDEIEARQRLEIV